MAQATQTIEQQFTEEFDGSRQRAMQALELFPSGITHDGRYMKPFPLYCARAAGSKKWDVDGHEIIDYAVGHGSLILGHNHPEVTAAVVEQLKLGTHYGAGHDRELEWGDWVQRLVPSVQRLKFTSSGTEATLLALRLARAVTQRDKILKIGGNFHGWHDFVVSGERPPFVDKASPGVPAATLESIVIAPYSDLEAIEQLLAARDIAGVILEPSGASWATIPLPEGFLAGLREITQRYGTILIFDEVITGFRWAPGGAQERFGITPDMTTMAKIVAGGLPGGAVGGRADIMEVLEFRDDPAWKKVPHPGTYNANPLSATAGATCLRLVSNPEVQQFCDAQAKKIRVGMNDVLVTRGAPGVVYGESSVFHILLGEECSSVHDGDVRVPAGISPERLKAANVGKIKSSLWAGMLLHGVDLFSNGGLLSIAHSDDDVEKTIAAFDVTVGRMQAEGII
ncbi:MAG: aspartate aminotransferase family protein [Chloroflexi bacterium]|nr:MAG: aspartate aminotransferase family protein [Chloroflexota bacterium]